MSDFQLTSVSLKSETGSLFVCLFVLVIGFTRKIASTYSNETFYYMRIERLVPVAFTFSVLLLEFYS